VTSDVESSLNSADAKAKRWFLLAFLTLTPLGVQLKCRVATPLASNH